MKPTKPFFNAEDIGSELMDRVPEIIVLKTNQKMGSFHAIILIYFMIIFQNSLHHTTTYLVIVTR